MSVHAFNWDNLWKEYTHLIQPDVYPQLMNHYRANAHQKGPRIADICIKDISIVESGEPLVDIQAQHHARIHVMYDDMLLKAHQSPKDIDPRAPQHGFVRQSVYTALERMVQELDRLASAFGYRAGSLQIYVFEGHRSLATQKELFDMKYRNIQQQHPDWTDDQVYQETSTWVSPYVNNVPAHSTGGALDMHIYDADSEQFIDLGRFNVGGPHAPTFSSSITEAQARNRMMMLIAAAHAGLVNYGYEFWHYSRYDRYWAFWALPEGKQVAHYGGL